MSQSSLRPGGTLRVDLTAANPGGEALVDAFSGVVLPAAVASALGCSAEAVAFFANSFASVHVRCLSSRGPFPPLIRDLTVAAGLASTSISGFVTLVLPPDTPVGTYLVFLVLTPPGAFADSRADPGDVLVIAVASFTVAP